MTSYNLLKSYVRFTSSTNADKLRDAKLQTATSSGAVYSTISVHRLEDFMVPRFCWLDFALQASLKSMYGVPTVRTQRRKFQIHFNFKMIFEEDEVWSRRSAEGGRGEGREEEGGGRRK